MTTLYLFHPWIEASETGDTVLSLYGQWWDGDAAAPGGPITGLSRQGITDITRGSNPVRAAQLDGALVQ
jgi:hypothetical protein